MQLIRKKPEITYQVILERIGSEAVYRAELGDVKIGRAMCNPLRKDISPSMCLFIGEEGHVLHTDYADDRYKGNCVNLVMQKYNLEWKEAINKIAKDWGLIEGQSIHQIPEKAENGHLQVQKRHSLIQVTIKAWDKRMLKYWADYGISQEELEMDDVYPIKEWYLNRQKQQMGATERCYAYKYEEGFQILMPDRSKLDKWKTNMPLSYIDGWDKVNGQDKILITKSKKDKLYLQRLLPFPVIRTMNESVAAFTPEVIEKLKGKQVWINYDTDEAGKKASWKVTKLLGCKHLNVPDILLEERITDYTDWRLKRGNDDEVISHLKSKGLI